MSKPRKAPRAVPVSPSAAEDRRTQEALARLAAIVESSDDAIVSKTLDGIVTSWNQSAQRLFGYAPEEILGRSITIIIPKHRQNEEAEILARILKGDRVEHYETIRRRKDGTYVEVLLSVSPVKDASGRIIGASKIARDISQRKRAEEEMNRLYRIAQTEIEDRRRAEARVRELNQELESRVRERTADLEAFSYTIAHDLRAPLRAIHRFSDLVLEDYRDRLDVDGKDALQRIAAGAARMDRMIQDLLAYSRIARAQIGLHPVDVGGVVAKLREQMAEEIRERNGVLRVSEGLPVVIAERTLLAQALENLVSNGLKFVDPSRRPEVHIGAEVRDDLVRLTVRDNGIGISPEYHNRLFGIFERLHPEEAYPGTGVGLAIVKKSVERMNGSLGLDSAPGRGSCFWIELPEARRQPLPAAE